jgi:Nucleotidyltransferase
MAASASAKFGGEMTVESPGNDHFVRLVQALNPWLNQIVIIGGWAHRLYRLHPLSQRLEFSLLTTLGADVAIPEKLPVFGQDLHERLKESGFEDVFLGEHRPPVTHYRLGENAAGFYAEFLTPLIGGTENRGKPMATISVAGVTCQKLSLHRPATIPSCDGVRQ